MARLEDYGARLRFPKNNPDDYKGVMEFRRITIAPPEVEVGNLANFFEQWLSVSLDDNNSQQEIEVPTTPGSDSIITGRRTHTNSYPNVSLYLPQAITLNDGVAYDNTVQLGIVGAAAEAGINNNSGISTAIVNGVARGLSSFSDLFFGAATPDMARLAVVRAQQMGPVPGAIQDAVSSALRTAVNPNRRTLFRAVNAREFSFQFKMVASSPEEAIDIDSIINFFRTEMYPESIGDDLSIGYIYPNMFDIRMKYADKKVGYSFLPCYLSSIQTVINPSSMSFHRDGKPSEVDITLTFLEERTLAKKDIREGK